MDVTEIGKQVAAPTAGDDGEAMAECENTAPLSCGLDSSQQLVRELVMPDNAGWYVAVVRCNCEKKIADSIKSFFDSEKKWFEYWVPLQKIVYLDKRSMKRKVREKPFLATFIFCHVGKNNLDVIRFRSDVYKMLTMPGHREIYRISDKELDDYRRLVENPDVPAVVSAGPLRKGQRVRVIEGAMAGLEAYVQRLSGKKAVIGNEIKYISGATIEIDRSLLEVIPEGKHRKL